MNGAVEAKLSVRDIQPSERVQAQNHTVARPASSRLALYCHRWATRRTLRGLTDDELLDIGMSVQQARLEAGKPFWRA